MSQQRICDLDGTPIDPAADEFFTVTNGRDGRSKDICIECARSLASLVPWQPETEKVVGDRVTPAGWTGEYLQYIFDVVTPGTTGTTEPDWPATGVGAVVTDGEVSYVARLVPKQNTMVHLDMPGSAEEYDLSIYGWVNGTGETAA